MAVKGQAKWGTWTGKTCSVDSCVSPVRGRGLCNKHLLRLQRYGDPLFMKCEANGTWTGLSCSVDGCDKPAKSKGMCSMHYSRVERHGDPHKRLRIANGEGNAKRTKRLAYQAKLRYLGTPHGKARRAFDNAKARAFAGTDRGIHKDDLLKVWAQATCGLCGKYFKSDDEKTFDHITPLSMGGTNALNNLTMAHMSCNQSKNNRHVGLDGDWSALLNPLANPMMEAVCAGD